MKNLDYCIILFKFQYDNTLRNEWLIFGDYCFIFKFQYDNTLSI